jgi:hypothetical protein
VRNLPRSIRAISRRDRKRARHRLGLLALIAAAASAVAPAGATATTSAAPSALDFGSVAVGTTSVAHPVELDVVCSSPVVGTCPGFALDAYYPHPATTGDFAATSDCGNPLGLGINVLANTCTISVTFTPTAPGLRSGTLDTGTIDISGLIPGPKVALAGTGTTSDGGARAGTGKTVKPSGVSNRRKCKKHRHRSALSAKKRKCRRHHAVA